jgi:hypothetical protein
MTRSNNCELHLSRLIGNWNTDYKTSAYWLRLLVVQEDYRFCNGTSGLAIWYGNGHGQFSPGPTIALTNPSNTFELADVNNDGRVDVVALECGSGCAVEVALQTASHTFTKSASLAVADRAIWSSLKVADINRDGKLDILLGTESASAQKVRIWKGNGTGTFGSATTVTVPTCDSSGTCYQNLDDVAIGDFYSNANLDLATVQEYCSPDDFDGLHCRMAVTLFKNDGSGAFTKQAPVHYSGGNGVSLLAGDLNGDQYQDILAYSLNVRNPTVYGLLGNGKGNFVFSTSVPGSAIVIRRDMSLSSRQDYIQTSNYAGDTSIAVNTTPATNCPPPPSNKLAARICSAGKGSTSSSILLKGSGNSPAGVQRMEIFVDGVKKTEAWADQIARQIILSAGTHTVTLIAVDQYKGTASTRVTVTVP